MAITQLPVPRITSPNWGAQLNNAITSRYLAALDEVNDEAAAREAQAEVAVLPADSLLRGMSLGMYGNSYGAKTSNAEYIYFDRLKSVIGSAVWNNLAVSGSLAADASSFAYGTFTRGRQGVNAISAVVSTAAGTFVPGVASIIYLIDIVRNDAGWDGLTTSGGTTAKSRAGFQNGLDSLIRRIRAASLVDNAASATVVYTGTWTHSTTSTYASSAKVSFTSTNGDKVVFTESGTDFDLVLIGLDASGSGSTGTLFEVWVDGVLHSSGTTNDTTRKTQSGAGNTGVGQLCVPIRGLAAGSHTVDVRHVGTGGTFLFVDGLIIVDDTPPTIIVMKTAELPAAGYATYTGGGGVGASEATDAIYDGIIDTVVAPFTADESVVVFDPMAEGFDPATMIGGTDGLFVHLNDVGNAFYATELLKIIRNLGPRAGLVLDT